MLPNTKFNQNELCSFVDETWGLMDGWMDGQTQSLHYMIILCPFQWMCENSVQPGFKPSNLNFEMCILIYCQADRHTYSLLLSYCVSLRLECDRFYIIVFPSEHKSSVSHQYHMLEFISREFFYKLKRT